MVSRLLPSSTVMTPSLPTLSMASAIILPICSSWLAERGADLGDFLGAVDLLAHLLSSSTMASTASLMPR